MAKDVVNINFDELKAYVASLFPDPGGNLMVPASEQQQELSLLKEMIGGERFHFVVDLRNFEITEKAGIQRWLGYSENSFSLHQYWNLVHPGRRNALMLVALELYKTLCSGKYALNFMVQRYSSRVALKHYKGHYLLAKKTASVFQYDAQNRLTAYLNEFTIIGPYNGEPLMPNFFTQYGDAESQKGDKVMQAVIERFMGMDKFSLKELQTARMLAYTPNITQARIAEELNVSANTVDTFTKRFLVKARNFFHHHFSSTIEAALYMKNEGLL